jgi:hypothetical protein
LAQDEFFFRDMKRQSSMTHLVVCTFSTSSLHSRHVARTFIGKPKFAQKEIERILSPGDSDETKLRKIYARVQQIRALSYEPEKSNKERKQASLKENKNAEDILNHGYAFANEINLLFIALSRAAAEKQGNTLHLKRAVKRQVYYLPVDHFQARRHFYEEVRTSDEQQAILQPQQEALNN